MCVLDKVVCSSLVVACILTRIIFTLVLIKTNTFLGQSENNVSISSQNLRKDFYHGFCLNRGKCYNVIVQEDEKAVECMCRPSYGGEKREKFRWWM